MNILITGIAGFIGSTLAEKLLSKDSSNKIIGIDNFDNFYSKELKLENLSEIQNNDNYKFYELDIRDENGLNNVFEKNKIDVVVHLAAKAGVRESFLNWEQYSTTNIEGTINILNCMKNNNVRKLVFASSSSIYGECKSEKFSEEELDLSPLSVYAQTKKTGEDFIKLYSNQFGINAVALRFFTVWGKRQRPDLAISKFTNEIINNQTVVLYGDGTTYRDYTHVDDITDGIISAISYNKTPFEIINLGSQKPVKLIDLVKKLENFLKKEAKIDYLPMQRGDVTRTYSDITKAQQLLNYSPKVDFDEGLKEFCQYMLDKAQNN